MSYARHEILVAPARHRPALWRTGLGLILAAMGQALALGVILAILPVAAPDRWSDLMADLMAPTTPVTALLVLFTFLGGGWFISIAARWLHKRSFGSLFGAAATTLRHFAVGVAVTSVVLAVSLLPWGGGFDAEPGLPLRTWVLLLPVAILALLIQTGAEELLFRGYLQSQLAARSSWRLVWLVLPSLLFGVLHYAPDMAGENAIWTVLAATLFGFAAADLTARTGSIGAAWGFHFANNAAAILILSTRGTIEGLALYLTPYSVDAPVSSFLVAIDLASVVLIWWLIRRVLRV